MTRRRLATAASSIAILFAAPGAASGQAGPPPGPASDRPTPDTSTSDEPAAAASTSGRRAATNSGEASFDDIVVTATRREERLQDVPVAVTAFTANTLAAQGIYRAEDLTRVTPSLQISRFVGNPAATSFGIRGQRTNDVRPHQDSAVITYIAEVPQKLPFGIGISGFLDLKSIEVLRGPQGTVFGRNSTGGAILLVPNTPTDQFEGSARLIYGNYNKIEAQAMANVPLGEGVGIRVAGVAGHRDPWYRNRFPGGRDFNEEDYVGLRGSFQYASGGFTTTFYGDYVDFKGSGQAGKVMAVRPGGAASLYPLGTGGAIGAILAENRTAYFWSSISNNLLSSTSESWGVSNTTTYQLSEELLIKNIIGYRDVRAGQITDADGTPYDLIQSDINDGNKQFSEELQLQYATEGFKLIAGGFYFREKGRDGYARSSTIALAGINAITRANNFLLNSARSVFAEGTYDIVPQLHLTLGARYTWDRRREDNRGLSDNRFNFAAPPEDRVIRCGITDETTGMRLPLDNCRAVGRAKFSKLTWNVTVQYEFDRRNQAYASYRRGYRTGGFILDGTTVGATQTPYRPETVDTYEVGYKGEFDLGGNTAARLNLAGYYSKYDDIQKSQNRAVGTPPNTTFITETVNAAKATIYGAEVEAALNIGDHLSLNGSYTYTNASYDRFVTTAGDLSDTPFGYVPKHKITGTARFELPVGSGDGVVAFQPTVVWQSSQFIEELAGPGTLQPKYALLNARAEWSPNERLTFAVFGTNLTKRKFFVAGNNVFESIGYTVAYPGEPRMYGVELSAKL